MLLDPSQQMLLDQRIAAHGAFIVVISLCHQRYANSRIPVMDAAISSANSQYLYSIVAFPGTADSIGSHLT